MPGAVSRLLQGVPWPRASSQVQNPPAAAHHTDGTFVNLIEPDRSAA